MSSDQITGLIREFGFPVLVALWFMFRLERRVERLFTLMTALMQVTALLAKSIDNIEGDQRAIRAQTDAHIHIGEGQ